VTAARSRSHDEAWRMVQPAFIDELSGESVLGIHMYIWMFQLDSNGEWNSEPQMKRASTRQTLQVAPSPAGMADCIHHA